jgi:4-amino-4-deoxy-L-arabinose transferase-like glycosyltransferase
MNAISDQSLQGWFRLLFSRVLFAGRPDPVTAVRLGSLLIVLVLPAAILYPTLGFHLLEPDEGRYAQIPKEMLTHDSWVVPTLQGEPYLDKPPLMYWLVALSYRALGVSPESARLVPALCVHLTILSVYLLGRRSIGERAAFWAALLLSVAPGFVCIARLLLLDGLLTLCVTLSVLCGFEAVRTGRLKVGWWLAAALASGCGFLTKGPISEVLLFVPLWAYGLLTRTSEVDTGEVAEPDPSVPARGSAALVQPVWYLVFLTIVIAVNAPWYVAIYREQPEFLGHFFWQHNVLRFLQPFDHLQPIWFYGPILLGGLLPGTILLVAYFYQLLRSGPEAAARRSLAGGFWLLTGLWCVFFFSCSGSKLPTYILPAYPFLCLATGEFLARTRWNRAVSTRAMIGVMAAQVLALHHYALPLYAQERSPYGYPDRVERFVDDPQTAIVCFPRNCDSMAFYKDRSDLHHISSRDVNQLFVDCHHRPRTVILFTHMESLEGLRQILPPSLEIAETVTLKRKNGNRLLDKLFGSTPWGLCDVAVVVPKCPPAGAQ